MKTEDSAKSLCARLSAKQGARRGAQAPPLSSAREKLAGRETEVLEAVDQFGLTPVVEELAREGVSINRSTLWRVCKEIRELGYIRTEQAVGRSGCADGDSSPGYSTVEDVGKSGSDEFTKASEHEKSDSQPEDIRIVGDVSSDQERESVKAGRGVRVIGARPDPQPGNGGNKELTVKERNDELFSMIIKEANRSDK